MTQLPLADHFKKATWDSHTEAETTGLINDILRGKASLENYISFLYNLQPVYKMMESSTEWLASFPEMKPFFGFEIHRSRALERDIENLVSIGKTPPASRLPQAYAYADQVKHALAESHHAMLAHIYVRYLGDLNGGLVLKRLLAKHLELDDDCLSFYDFPRISNIVEYRMGFRGALNAIILNESERKEAADAAINAFTFNVKISKALQGSSN